MICAIDELESGWFLFCIATLLYYIQPESGIVPSALGRHFDLASSLAAFLSQSFCFAVRGRRCRDRWALIADWQGFKDVEWLSVVGGLLNDDITVSWTHLGGALVT
jgi:hypothetical protein